MERGFMAERRLRPIYEALDSRNPRQAIKLCDAALKKGSFALIAALKAVALTRGLLVAIQDGITSSAELLRVRIGGGRAKRQMASAGHPTVSGRSPGGVRSWNARG